MFALLGLVLGCISATVIAYIHFLIAEWTGWVLIDFTFWFILPLGGAVLGFLGSSGVMAANLIGNGRIESSIPLALVGLLTGFLTWILIWNFMFSASGYSGFNDFLQDMLRNAHIEIGVKYHHAHSHGDLGEAPFLAQLGFFVQPIGALFGGLIAGLTGKDP